MKLNIITEKESELLGRKEYKLSVEFEGATPKTADVNKEIASLTKSQEDLVVVKAIKNKYGEEKADIAAYVYNSIDDLKKLEEYVEPVVEEESAAEEKTEEAPAEEVKEETATEAPAEEAKEAPTEEKKE